VCVRVMQLDMMVVAKSVLCHHQLVGFKSDVAVLFFSHSLCVLACMSNHKRCCTHPGFSAPGSPSQHKGGWRSCLVAGQYFQCCANAFEVHLPVWQEND
jgi:hypothetical protein